MLFREILCYAPGMQKYIIHFRTSLFFGLLILLSLLSSFETSFRNLSTTKIGVNFPSSNHFLGHEEEPSVFPAFLAQNDHENGTTEEQPGIKPEPSEPITPAEPAWSATIKTALIIKAVNPGYTIDGVRDVGELIELQKISDAPLSLAGYEIRYTNSSGKSTLLLSFSEGSTMTGETLLARLARSAGDATADLTYNTTLALSGGPLEILYNGEVVDSVCWTGKDICEKPFKSNKPTSLVRDLDTGKFEHIEDYEPQFDPSKPSLILPPEPEEPSDNNDQKSEPSTNIAPKCRGLEFSEVFAYYADEKSEQFLELHNPTDHDVDLSGCHIRYKKKKYGLTGMMAVDGYYAYYPNVAGFSLTKNPNSSNTVELIDADGKLVDTLVYNHGQKKSTAYAQFYGATGEETWLMTYAPTPAAPNLYQEYRSCPEGKVINPATGNCVKAIAASTAPTDCPPGKYRNPLTGRCKNIETESGPKPCAEGYERNPETNRCRKIKRENDGAGYTLTPVTYSDNSTFIAFGVVAALVAIGVIYIILQFRREIVRFLRKVRQRLHHIGKSLRSRHIHARGRKKL